MRFRYFLCCLLFSAQLLTAKNHLLTAPTKIPAEKILASFQSVSADFGSSGKGIRYRNGAVSLYVKFDDRLPDCLTAEERHLFTEMKSGRDKERRIFVYEFGSRPGLLRLGDNKHTEVSPRAFDQQTVQPGILSVEACAELIQNKRILFFTGAGISASAGVHTVRSLWEDLGIDFSEEIDAFVYQSLRQPEEVVKRVLSFYQTARDSDPTAAHYSLERLARFKECQIVSGNFDRLHERAGSVPFRVYYEDWREKVELEWFKEIDVILCLGMSHDIDAFLAAYKKENPEGVIVAFDVGAPSFLGSEDFLLKGDLQKTLPAVERVFTAKG